MNVDWSFSNAPEDDAAPPPPPAPRPPQRPLRQVVPWRLIVVLAGLAAVVALGAWLFTELGWLRLQAQVAAQAAYEDQRAQAGDVAAVLAVWGPLNPDERNEITAQVQLGLAAPLPTGDLRPTGAPPRLAHLDPLGGDRFAATITRDYLDPAGQTVSFDLLQTYHNLSPGVWERLPILVAPLAALTTFHGQRLYAQVPTVDLPWLGPALLQADSLIVQACADWGDTYACRAQQSLVIGFGVPPPGAWDQGRWADATPRPANLPRIFFLQGSGPVDLLASPLLAGRPHDAAAQADYSRSVAAQLLGLFAGQIASGPEAGRGSADYFLDALVARVEARHLGATGAGPSPAAYAFVPLDALWNQAGAYRLLSAWHTDLSLRLEAYNFVNAALAGQPSTTEGRLVGALRQPNSAGVEEWLATALGPPAYDLQEQWTSDLLAKFAAQPAQAPAADGLVLACDNGIVQRVAGAWRVVQPGPLTVNDQDTLVVGEVSPDGAYLWLQTNTASGANGPSVNLKIIRLADGAVVGTAGSPFRGVVQVLGWTAGNTLIFGVNDLLVDSSTLGLMVYTPGGQAQPLIPERVYADVVTPWSWSADRTRLLLGLPGADPNVRTPAQSWALLTLSPTISLRPLMQTALSALLSPDGAYAAFLEYSGPTSGEAAVEDGLERVGVLNLASGQVIGLAATNDATLPGRISRFGALAWSDDSQALAWGAFGDPSSHSALLAAPAAGGPLRLWLGATNYALFPIQFSPQGGYLLADVASQPGPDRFWVLDTHTPGVTRPLTGWAGEAGTGAERWLPNSHRLVVASAQGVSSVDPASGDWDWLGEWRNCQLR